MKMHLFIFKMPETSCESGIWVDMSDGDLSISLSVQTHNPNNYGEPLYSPGPDGFESLVYELDRWDDSHDDILNAIVEKFSINGVIKGPAATRAQDTITYLEQTLKNFDQIDIEKKRNYCLGRYECPAFESA